MAVFESKLTATVFHLIPLILVDQVVKKFFLGSGPNRSQREGRFLGRVPYRNGNGNVEWECRMGGFFFLSSIHPSQAGPQDPLTGHHTPLVDETPKAGPQTHRLALTPPGWPSDPPGWLSDLPG